VIRSAADGSMPGWTALHPAKRDKPAPTTPFQTANRRHPHADTGARRGTQAKVLPSIGLSQTVIPWTAVRSARCRDVLTSGCHRAFSPGPSEDDTSTAALVRIDISFAGPWNGGMNTALKDLARSIAGEPAPQRKIRTEHPDTGKARIIHRSPTGGSPSRTSRCTPIDRNDHFRRRRPFPAMMTRRNSAGWRRSPAATIVKQVPVHDGLGDAYEDRERD
jgi:hypothetical protein